MVNLKLRERLVSLLSIYELARKARKVTRKDRRPMSAKEVYQWAEIPVKTGTWEKNARYE